MLIVELCALLEEREREREREKFPVPDSARVSFTRVRVSRIIFRVMVSDIISLLRLIRYVVTSNVILLVWCWLQAGKECL